MKRRLSLCAALIAVVSLSMSVSAASLSELFGPLSEIVVYGDASISVVPDRATVQMSVITYSETTSTGQSENAVIVEAVKKTLRDIGITEIETVYFYSYPMEYYEPKPMKADQQEPINRYRFEHTLRVKTETERVGQVIDTAIRAGVSSIISVSFDVSDIKKYQDELMHMAYRDAINKAYSIARSSGLKILFPILVEEQSGTYMPYVTRGANLTMAAEAAYVPTDITPGQQVMNLRLRVVFAAQALPR